MYLQRKFVLCVEQFDQQGETWALGHRAEDIGSSRRPKFVQRLAAQFAIPDHALRLLPIDQFPGFTDFSASRQLLAELRFEPASAPDALHEDGLKGQRLI